MEVLHVYNSKIKFILGFLFCFGFLAIAYFGLGDKGLPEQPLVLVVVVLIIPVMAILGLVFLKGILSNDPVLEVDDSGLFDKRMRVGKIPWGEIRSVQSWESSIPVKFPPWAITVRAIDLVLKSPEKYSRRRPYLLRKINKNKFHVGCNGLSISCDEIYNFILSKWRRFGGH